MTRGFNADHDHFYLLELLNYGISPGHRNRWRSEEVTPLFGGNVANLSGIYSISNTEQPDPCELVEKLQLIDVVAEVLETLTPTQKMVIVLRFGIQGKEHTLEETGSILKITRERVRQIEAKALRKLRKPERCRRLVTFLKS